MSINDLPTLSVLRTKMQWHQERQRVLAENVSNSDTPEFQAARPGRTEIRQQRRHRRGTRRDRCRCMRTSAGHIIGIRGADETFDQNRRIGFETRPAGNAVSLEDEMLKVSANQMDYAAVTSLYSKSLHLLKTAIGKA